MKKKALSVIDEVTSKKKQNNVDLVSAIIKCDMDANAKLELLKNFF